MTIETLGQLMDWLLRTPRTRLETLQATRANPEDLSAAISLLVAGNHLCVPVLASHRLLFRGRSTGGTREVLKQRIAGCHERNRCRNAHRCRAWIDVAVHEAGRIWRDRAEPAGNDTETAVLAETFLARWLGRRATDREIRLFWDQVESAL